MMIERGIKAPDIRSLDHVKPAWVKTDTTGRATSGLSSSPTDLFPYPDGCYGMIQFKLDPLLARPATGSGQDMIIPLSASHPLITLSTSSWAFLLWQ